MRILKNTPAKPAEHEDGHGSWESVETMAVLAIATHGRPEAAELIDDATRTASQLKAGTWESVRALAWLARAQHEMD